MLCRFVSRGAGTSFKQAAALYGCTCTLAPTAARGWCRRHVPVGEGICGGDSMQSMRQCSTWLQGLRMQGVHCLLLSKGVSCTPQPEFCLGGCSVFSLPLQRRNCCAAAMSCVMPWHEQVHGQPVLRGRGRAWVCRQLFALVLIGFWPWQLFSGGNARLRQPAAMLGLGCTNMFADWQLTSAQMICCVDGRDALLPK